MSKQTNTTTITAAPRPPDAPQVRVPTTEVRHPQHPAESPPAILPPDTKSEFRATTELPPSRAFTIWTEGEVKVHGPVLFVVRGMPSTRHVLCRLGDRADLVCDVRQAGNFRAGMMIHGAVRVEEAGSEGRLWRYAGMLPRRPGKW